MTAVSDETGRELPSVTDLLLEAARHADNLGKSEWAKSAREAVRRAALSASPVAQEPVARINRDVLKELQKHKTATGTVSSPLLKKPFGCDVALYTSPPATPAGLGADEIVRIADDLRSISDQTKTMHYKLISLGLDRAERSLRALALLSRAGDQGNSTQKEGSR